MGERYSEADIHRQIHDVPLQERRKMVQEILTTIDPNSVRRGRIRHSEMTFPLTVKGLTFIGSAWEFRREIPNTFLDDDRDEPEKGYKKLIEGINHWWPHAPKPQHHSRIMNRRYDAFMKKLSEDYVLRGAISTAIVVVCMRNETVK